MKNIINLLSMGSGRIAQAAISFIAVSIVARHVSVEELGVYSIILALFAYASLFSDFGLRSIITSEWNRKQQNHEEVIVTYFVLRLALSLIICCVGSGLVGGFYPEYLTIVLVVLISTFFISLQLDWYLIVSERYLAASWVLVLRTASYLFFIGVLIYIDEVSLQTLAFAFLLSWCFFSAGSWLSVKSKVTVISMSNFSFQKARYLVKRGWPVMAVSIIGQAILNLDLIFIGKIFGAEKAAHYYVASAIIVAGMVFSNALTQISLGKMSKYIDDKNKFNQQLITDIKLALVVAVFLSLLVIFIGRPLIPIAFGTEYEESAALLIYFIPFFVISHVTGIVTSCLITINLQKQLMYINLIRLSGLFLCLYLLTTFTQYIGWVALMKALVDFIVIILMLWCYKYRYPPLVGLKKESHVEA